MPQTEPTRTQAILQRIIDRTHSAPPPDEWEFLSGVRSIRQLADDDSALIAALEGEFSDEDLEASRVFVPAPNDELQLSPVLACAPSTFMVLRRGQDGPPFDLVGQAGSVTTDDPPAFHICDDHFTKVWSRHKKKILVGFSMRDVAVLRMLGMPCAPAGGLEYMDGEQVRRLLDIRVKKGASTQRSDNLAAVCRAGFQLTLVGWQVADFRNEIPEGLHEVVSHLRKAESAYQCDTQESVEVWRPAGFDWDRIQSALDFADRDLFRRLMWASIARSTLSLRRFEKAISPVKVDYSAARDELLKAIKRAREVGLYTDEVKMKLKALNRAFDKTVVDAMIRDAMSASDSVDRSLLLAAAELMQHWHHSSELIQSSKPSHDDRLYKRDEVLQPEEMTERLRVVNGLVRIQRELTRRK